MIPSPQSFRQIHFVTGRLAEMSLRRQLESLAVRHSFAYTVQVMPITVAALLSTPWVAARLQVPAGTDLVVLPGYCQGELAPVTALAGCDVRRGPKDLRLLSDWFGGATVAPVLDQWTIEIIAEINHAPQLSRDDILLQAKSLIAAGADFIDVGCEPGTRWLQVGDAVKAICDLGVRVSIDSMQVAEISDATRAGASLVLSVNAANRQAASQWGCPVVVIPDDPADWLSLESNVDYLIQQNVPFRIDPILEPIGFGFAASLARYQKARQQWPEAAMMMGIGNLTELTDADSAGINLLLLAICQELNIHSILTTQVINWSRSSVREIDIGRRLVHYSLNQQVPPKRISDQLVMLRDPKVIEEDLESLVELSKRIKDPNYRIFKVGRTIVCLGDGKFWSAEDPFKIIDQMVQDGQSNLSPSHSFYLGYEMCKAMIAGQLSKQYQQDQALNWGYLTESEIDRHRLSIKKKN